MVIEKSRKLGHWVNRRNGGRAVPCNQVRGFSFDERLVWNAVGGQDGQLERTGEVEIREIVPNPVCILRLPEEF